MRVRSWVISQNKGNGPGLRSMLVKRPKIGFFIDFWDDFWRIFLRKLKTAQCLIANCSAHRRPTETSQCSLKRPCPGNFKKYKTISVGSLWAEQFLIKVEQFSEKSKKLDFLKKYSCLIADCSAHRLPTEMVLYFLKFSGQGLSR